MEQHEFLIKIAIEFNKSDKKKKKEIVEAVKKLIKLVPELAMEMVVKAMEDDLK